MVIDPAQRHCTCCSYALFLVKLTIRGGKGGWGVGDGEEGWGVGRGDGVGMGGCGLRMGVGRGKEEWEVGRGSRRGRREGQKCKRTGVPVEFAECPWSWM